jgi:2-polyprenyl-3-methyl-5-hydroxy-6-metoxy-1,4-benzoquinol methylase
MNQDGEHPIPFKSGDDAEDYAKALESDYGFEAECVRARFGCLLRHLLRVQSRRILEVGCGLELFVDAAIRSGVDFERWVVIEPASMLAQKARTRAATEPRLLVIDGYCEDPAVGKAARELGPFDVVLISQVLHEVEDPVDLLHSALALAAPGAHVLVTTPNALSFHRLLAVEMGLMPTHQALSPRNLRFRQGVVFDPDRLRILLEQVGLLNLQFEGYMFKPFTHVQMARVLELLPPGVSEGLDRLGQKFPQHAAEIAYIGVKG